MHQSENNQSVPAAKIPRTFMEYLRSFGPGIVVVLTWLGAGDIVDSGVAGGNYEYALMWVLVLAAMVRFVFVSLIAKYQLCNPHGESVLDGLIRLHAWYAPFLVIASIGLVHVQCSYMLVGCGETWSGLTGRGATWQWSLLWLLAGLALVFRPMYQRIETVFKVMLAVLAVSLVGSALWVGPNPAGIFRGAFTFAVPGDVGRIGAMVVAVSMIGALGGSMMNLAYPYFMEMKGWRGPRYRRLQTYDLLLGVAVMIILNLAVWTLGAEVVYGSSQPVENLDDLTGLLSDILGPWGRRVFLMGVFAAVFTSYVGIAMVLALIASHGFRRWRGGASVAGIDEKSTPVYRCVVLWGLISPMIWTIPGMPGFVRMTVIGNALQVPLLPILAGGVWWITASGQYIGREHRNRIWENLVMLLTFALAMWGSIELIRKFVLPADS